MPNRPPKRGPITGMDEAKPPRIDEPPPEPPPLEGGLCGTLKSEIAMETP